jgi:hypothetical protein
VGYKPKRYKLTWADGDLEGLEVVMKPASLGEMLNAEKLRDLAAEGASIAQLEPLFRWFAGMLVSWNVEDDDDQPVPATYEGVLTQDVDLIYAIVGEFTSRVTQAPPPLPDVSPPGGTEAEASLRLASSSRSLAS